MENQQEVNFNDIESVRKKVESGIKGNEFAQLFANACAFGTPEFAKGHNTAQKMFGWPTWVQREEYPHCDICKKQMRLFYQIDFGKIADTYFIFQCPEHKKQFKYVTQGY